MNILLLINIYSFVAGTAVKKAKIMLAKAALKQLYGIDNVYPTA